jgi:phage terminase large subunit
VTDREQLVSAMVRWRSDAVAFAEEVLGVTLDEWQKKALRILSQSKPLVRLALAACKGPGKSFLLAVIALWWFFTRRHAQIIVTSITSINLKDGLMKEIMKLFGGSQLLRSVADARTERIIMKDADSPTGYDPEWFISFRSWAKDADASAQASTLAGLHGNAMMYLGDEVGDYPPGVLPAAEAMASGAGIDGNECRIVVAGNLTDINGPLYGILKDSVTWERIHITADPDDPLRTTRVNADEARKTIERLGRDHPYVRVNILGQFPLTALNTLLSPDDIIKSQHRQITQLDYHWAEKRLSVDVARFGLDKTVIGLRQGIKLGPFIEMQGAGCQDVAARISLAQKRTGAAVILIDADGVGGGVVDACRTANLNVVAVHSAGKPISDRYYNRKAEMWYEMAEWVKDRGVVPTAWRELADDLTAPRYSFHKGKILIEEKDEVRKRLGRSPDYGDCTALSFALPDAATVDPLLSLAMMQQGTNKGSRNWDPITGEIPAERGGADYDPLSRF